MGVMLDNDPSAGVVVDTVDPAGPRPTPASQAATHPLGRRGRRGRRHDARWRARCALSPATPSPWWWPAMAISGSRIAVVLGSPRVQPVEPRRRVSGGERGAAHADEHEPAASSASPGAETAERDLLAALR